MGLYMSGQNFSHIFESDRWTICHRAFVNLMTLRFPAYLGNDPGLGLVRIVDELGVLEYLLPEERSPPTASRR